MADHNITDDAVGLKKIVEQINTLTPRPPPVFCTETPRIRFIRHVVLMQPWTDEAAGNITSAEYILKAFMSALREQVQLKVENKFRGQFFSFQLCNSDMAAKRRKKIEQQGKNPVGRNGKRMLGKR